MAKLTRKERKHFCMVWDYTFLPYGTISDVPSIYRDGAIEIESGVYYVHPVKIRRRHIVREYYDRSRSDVRIYSKFKDIVFNDYDSAWNAMEQDCWNESCYPSF